MAFEFNRNQQDAAYTSSVAIAQAGANSAVFDLEQVFAGDIQDFVVEVAAPAASGINNASVLTYTLQDSADGTNFLAVDPAISSTQTGSGGVGVAAKAIRFRTSPSTRRYIRIAQTASATAGTFAGQLFTAKLLF
jgi:hypothetical protein